MKSTDSNQKLPNGQEMGRLFADAEAGVASAQFDLSQAYENGQVIAVDPRESIRWLRIAAQNGHSGALFRLGLAFQRGIAVDQDSRAAVECFLKGAEQGNDQCQCALADAYRDGRGVTKDEGTAVSWYTKAAEQGSASAQYRLGKMYRYGNGVPRNINTAIQFFSAAAAQGHSEAATALEKAKQVPQQARPVKTSNQDPQSNPSSAPHIQRKIPLVMIDTSVLLQDPDVIRRVVGNKGLPCITNTILSELDNNKKNPDYEVAKNAKLLLRELAKANPIPVQELPGGGVPMLST